MEPIFFRNPSGPFWAGGDFTQDGIVSFDDFTLLSENFGKTAADEKIALVPEPKANMMALFGLLFHTVIRKTLHHWTSD